MAALQYGLASFMYILLRWRSVSHVEVSVLDLWVLDKSGPSTRFGVWAPTLRLTCFLSVLKVELFEQSDSLLERKTSASSL